MLQNGKYSNVVNLLKKKEESRKHKAPSHIPPYSGFQDYD